MAPYCTKIEAISVKNYNNVCNISGLSSCYESVQLPVRKPAV